MLITVYYNKVNKREAHVISCPLGYFVPLYENRLLVFNKGFFYDFPIDYVEQYAYDFVTKKILG